MAMLVPPPPPVGYTQQFGLGPESAFSTPNFVSDDGPGHSGYMCVYILCYTVIVYTHT